VAVLWIENPAAESLEPLDGRGSRRAGPDLEKDDSVHAAVLTGAEHTHFCAGLDMDEWSRLSPKAAQDEMSRGQDAFWALEHLTKPTIAQSPGRPEARGRSSPSHAIYASPMKRGLLAPGNRSRMDAQPRWHRAALEDRRSIPGARDPPGAERGEGPRRAPLGDRESPRLSRRCTRSSEGPRDHIARSPGPR